jgi:spectinomycin phosphotransferase
MLEPPDLAQETILAALSAHFGIVATALEFIPRGEDSWAWVYRAETADGLHYLLKVRRGQVNKAGLAIPRFLQDQGVEHIVAPLPAAAGALWGAVDEYALMVYPFVAGRSAFEAGMSEAQWIEYGTVLRQIHATALPSHLLELVRRETYVPKSSQVIRDLDSHIAARSFDDPLEQVLVAVWRARRAQIHRLVDRSEALGLRLRSSPLPAVLCHADIHTANVLLDAEGRLWIIDWDEAMLAPKERDLMFVVGGIGSEWVNPQQTQWFFRGYGRTAVDPLALAYYRYDWAVQDIAEFAARVMLRPELGPDSKRSALRYFMMQFQPGDMVEIAESSGLP